MEARPYKIIRSILFWFFFFAFVICLPLVILYSLGYQFNHNLKCFQKTGIISIKSSPINAEVYLEGKKIEKLTPCDLKELLPGIYKIKIEKGGFYPYEINIEVKSSLVSELSVVLIPKIQDVEKIKLDRNFYKFFVMEHLFGKRIIAFAKDG
ncbi:MAG: PEGA domain-containing protein, partial [Candidatus Omnitrophica bacterium]|nr:PEGA domain-containing protein [Candidatus Omnitrophota bacterium]